VVRDQTGAAAPSYLRRKLDYAVLPRKAVILKGVRRSGKSTLLRQEYLVTANDSDIVELASGTVHVRPAWE